MAEDIVVGELSERNECEPFIFKEITWKILNVSSLLLDDERVCPKFYFANGIWALSTVNASVFTLLRLQSLEAEQEVYYKVSVLSSHNKEIRSFIGSSKVTDNSHSCGDSYRIHHSFLTQSELDEYLQGIAPEDTLTVICQIHMNWTAPKAPSWKDDVRPVTCELEKWKEYGSLTFKKIIWKLPNVLSFPRYAEGKSPKFFFANSIWSLSISRAGSFTIDRLESLEARSVVHCRILIESSDGQEIEIFKGFHNFTSDLNKYGGFLFSPNFQTRSELIATEGVLTVICLMQINRTTAEAPSRQSGVRPVTNVLTEKNEYGPFIFKEIIWKIPDFIRPLRFVETELKSPEFSFKNGTWVLCMDLHCSSNAELYYGSDTYDVNFRLRKLQPLEEEEEVHFKLSLKTCRGENLENSVSRLDSTSFNKISFKMECSERDGKMRFLEPDDTLVVVFRIYTKKTVVDSTSQEGVPTPATSIESEDKNHQTEIFQDFEELDLGEENDIFLANEYKLKAPRFMFGTRCSILASMLSGGRDTILVDIGVCDPKFFPDILYFLYFGSVRITPENVRSLFRFAVKFDVEDLLSECLVLMNKLSNLLDVDSFCDVVTLALKSNDTNLIRKAVYFFDKNMLKILQTDNWKAFLIKNPIQSNELIIKALSVNKNKKSTL